MRDNDIDTCGSSSAAELNAHLEAAFVNPGSTWKKLLAFKAKHGLSALLSELANEKRRRFGREPGGLSSGLYFTDEGREIRRQADIAKKALPALVAAYFARELDEEDAARRK